MSSSFSDTGNRAEALEKIIDQSWASIEFSLDGTVLAANVNFLRLFEYSSMKEIEGQHHRIFCKEEYTQSAEYERFWDELRNSEIKSGEFERKTKNGNLIWLRAAYSPVTDANGNVIRIIKIAADITANKKLQQQAKSIEAVVNRGWVSVEFNADGTILVANDNFIKLFEYSSIQEVQGQHHRIFCHEDYANSPDYKNFWDALRNGEIKSGEFERKTKQGHSVWLHAAYSPVTDSKGNIIRIIKIASDITSGKKVAEEIKKLRLRELNEAQNQLIQSEKMASLGNLVAGIAHEINTPLGAIKASIEGVLENKSSYQKLFDLFNLLTEDESKLFLDMLKESISGNAKATMSSKEERIARKTLRNDIEELGINGAYEIADIMSDMGLIATIEQYKPLIYHKNNVQIFTTASDITVQHRNGGTIKIAVDKASKIIFALKSYAHFDNEDTFTEANIIDGIENIITLYSNTIKQGIELVKHYDNVPALKCLPDQLGQIWTNLIANSIHAMNGKGVLTISVLDKPHSVLIHFEDSGKGIPKDVENHIFKPFFTTKSSGEGSGLGLHLVKKIVDKHGGDISVVSNPGKTVFTIEIPKKEYINDKIIQKANELHHIEQVKEAELKEKLKALSN